MGKSPRFSHITFLHDANDLPNGRVAQLADILKRQYPSITISRPYIPTVPTGEALSWVKQYVARVPAKSLIIGMGRGGLLACALQSNFPALNFSVVAVNAPTEEDGVYASESLDRVVLYSSLYEPIKGRCDWQDLAMWSFEVSWLTSGQDAFYPTMYMISAYLQGDASSTALDLLKAANMLVPFARKDGTINYEVTPDN